LLLRQFTKGALHVPHLQARGLTRQATDGRSIVLQFDPGPLARIAAGEAYMLVVQDRE